MRFWQKVLPQVGLAGIFTLILALSLFLPISNTYAEDANGVSDLSLYQRASELTREFATALAPGTKTDRLYMLEASESTSLLVAGNAGALLGYAEILADDEGVIGWLMNAYTTASATITYDQLMHVVDNGGDSVYDAGLNNPFFQYAGYGEVLTEMGLISTIRPGITSMGRAVASGLVIIVYLLANVAPFLFRGALTILTTLNPFKLFETVFNGAGSADLGMISGIAEYVGDIYTTVQDFSILFLMPMLLVLTVLSILMVRKSSAMKKFSRYGVRVFMLFAGLPLIGATYTGLIEDLDSNVSVGSEYADYLVLSSYVDFENWVKYSRLAPPPNSDIRNPRYGEDEERSLSDRHLILDVNGARAANPRAEALKARYQSTSKIGEIFEEGSEQETVDGTNRMGLEEKSSFSKIFSILSRHMFSARYTSSDYDGEVAGQIQKMRANNRSEENDEAIVKMFSLTASDNRTWSQKINPFNDAEWLKPIYWNGKDNKEESSAKGLFTANKAKYELFQFTGYPFNIYNTGNLQYNANKGYHSPDMPDVVTKKTAPIGADRAGTVGGLSPIAMYNFLNTTFSNTGLTVYSPTKTASDLSRDSYAAVTFGGSGVASVTRWIEDMTVMLSLALLSICFGIMMISAAIKNIPRILSGVFGTAFGSIAFATKLLISTAVLLIQIVGLIFLYGLSEDIIMTLLLNFNELMSVGGEYFGGGVIFEFLNSFLVTAVTAAVTHFAIKNMKTFRELMEEVVSNAINRVMSALDTGTGGKGLDLAQTTGGRIGSDGHLTKDAKEADTGLLGASSVLGAAHALEAKREALDNERGGKERTPAEKLKARFKTARDLAEAKQKDKMAGAIGIDGQSFERAKEAKEAMLMRQNPSDKQKKDGQVDSSSGQLLDENGEPIKDTEGNAMDVNGNSISAATPLGAFGPRLMTASDGSLLDREGNTYRDEAGNAFYQNEKGQLVDENGRFVALDKDGTLQPVTSIPGHNGKPVTAAKEAKKLDDMRFNAEKYGAMRQAQNTSHYGLDGAGNVVDAKGDALQVKGVNGQKENARLDDAGFIVDKQGNRVPASEVMGAVDTRGFEQVTDPATGATHVKHKGDDAMKQLVASSSQENQDLTTLARQSNRANQIKDQADNRVEALKENGAPPYAIMQAQRFADKAGKDAQMAQNQFNQAIKQQATPKGGAKTTVDQKPVQQEHVESATRYAKAQQAALQTETQKLDSMKAEGAPERAITRQARKVEASRQAAQQASQMEQSTRLAKKAGRSFHEVHHASERVNRAQELFGRAQMAHSDAIESGQPKEVVARYEKRMNQASNVLSKARSTFDRVTQPPIGSRSEIDKATAYYEKAEANYQKATQQVQLLEHGGGSEQDIKKAKRRQAQANRKVIQTRNHRQSLLNPSGWSNESVPQVKDVPQKPIGKSYTELASSGVTTYDDYKKDVTKQMATVKESKAKLQQAQSRLASLRGNKRPAHIIQQAQAQVNDYQSSVERAQTKLTFLQENAQGLLKNGRFQPLIASKPIRKNGTAIINQLVHMSHTQDVYDELASQETQGSLTTEGRKRMNQLSKRLSSIRGDLISSGIREDALRDSAALRESTKHMQQSWDAFINGKSVEHRE